MCSIKHGTVATLYTDLPLASRAMGKPLHDPQEVLSRNLGAVLKKRDLAVREVERQMKAARPGSKISNRTIQNMVNGTGTPQLDNLIAVAEHLHIPLWQFFCPGIDAGRFGADTVHQLVEQFCSLSEIGRARFLQNLEDAVVTEQVKRGETSTKNSA